MHLRKFSLLFGRVLKEMLPCHWFAEIYTDDASYSRSFDRSFEHSDHPRLQSSLGSLFTVKLLKKPPVFVIIRFTENSHFFFPFFPLQIFQSTWNGTGGRVGRARIISTGISHGKSRRVSSLIPN